MAVHGLHNQEQPGTYFVVDCPNAEELQRFSTGPLRDGNKANEQEETGERLSWSELSQGIEAQDLLIEGSLTLRVAVSIERPHEDTRDKQGHLKSTLGNGWLISLALSPSSPDDEPFSDGESLMACEMHYLSEKYGLIAFADVKRALHIDPDAKIWQVRPALRRRSNLNVRATLTAWFYKQYR